MANIKSQKKRIKTNEKAHLRNVAIKTEIKSATRKVKDAVADKKAGEALAAALHACKLLDKAHAKGVIHKNQAAKRKSGIMALANTIVTDKERKAYKPEPTKKPEKKGGTKKAAAKKARQEAMKKASAEKAKRREKTQKAQKAADKKRAAEEAAAKAEEEQNAEQPAEEKPEEAAPEQDVKTEEKPAEEKQAEEKPAE